MLADPYTIYIDGYTDMTVTASLMPQQSDGRTTRALSAPTGADRGAYPEILTIAKQIVGRGAAMRDRVMFRFEGVSIDATSGETVYGTHAAPVVTLVCDYPRNYRDPDFGDLAPRYVVGLLRGLTGNTADTAAYSTYYEPIILGQA